MLVVKPHSKASRLLDALRFAAALIVFLVHATANHILPGYQAVMVFFVLSGYLIGITVLKPMREGRWSWKMYLTNRVTRLWVVLLPALLLTLAWSRLQISLFGPSTFDGFDGWRTLLGNAFFLQGIAVIEYGDNGPLWSLSYEFWYYILFPCLALVYYSKKWTAKLLYAVFAVVLALLLGKWIMMYFLIWLLGAMVAFLEPAHLQRFRKPLAVGCAVVVTLVASKALYDLYGISSPVPHNPGQFVPDLSVGIACALLVYTIVSAYNDVPAGNSRLLSWSSYAAGFSYTLYLVHQPVLHFLEASRTVDGSILNTSNGIVKLALKAAIFFGILAYAWALSRLTEARTDQVRRWFLQRTNAVYAKVRAARAV